MSSAWTTNLVDMTSAWTLNLYSFECIITNETSCLWVRHEQRNFVKQCGLWIIVIMSSVWISNLCSYDFCEQEILVVVNTVWTRNIFCTSAVWTTSLETSVGIGWDKSTAFFIAVWQVSLTLLSKNWWIFAGVSRVVRFYTLWVVSLDMHWKMFTPTVSRDSTAKCGTQYASSGFGGILKKGIEMESPHAVHIFFELLRSLDGAVGASSMVVCLIWIRFLFISR